jgi:sugar phosphate isomerase/epimerase
MIRLSAFGDEISPDLDEQIAVMLDEGIRHLELRAAWGTNVLALTDDQVNTIKQTLDANSMGVSAIASPIGKTRISTPFDVELARFERALSLAQIFETPFIRIFSFYPPDNTGFIDPGLEMIFTLEVVERLRQFAERAEEAGVTLLHENEKDIFGDTIERCSDLFQRVDSDCLYAAFDPANFIQCGQQPFPDAYESLRHFISAVHVKDALHDGTVVPAGEGEARWPELLQRLRRDGYDSFLSLEPHLASAGQLQGFSGPELFRRASQALQGMLREMDWEYG